MCTVTRGGMLVTEKIRKKHFVSKHFLLNFLYNLFQYLPSSYYYSWIVGFGVYLILGILDQDDWYKELTQEAVFNVKISFMMTCFKVLYIGNNLLFIDPC